MGSHAKTIDGRARIEQLLNRIFLETAAHKNLHTAQAGGVEQLAGFPGEARHVSGIQTNSGNTKFRAEFPCKLDHVFDTFQGIEGVDKESCFGKASDEPAEGLQFICVRLDEAVRHRARDRYAVSLTRQCAAGAANACDVKGARLLQAGVGAVHSAQAKIHNLPAARGVNHASGLGSGKSCHLSLIHEKRFDELSLRQGSDDLDDRLVWKNHGSLGHRIDIAGKFEIEKTL